VVIVSILIAFALDAAWDARSEAREARSALVALHADLLASRGIAESELARLASVKTSVSYLLDAIHSSRVDAPADSVSYAIVAMQRKGDFGYPTGAYDALLGSGRLSLIEDDALRRELAAFVGFLGLLREVYLAETEQWTQIHQPFLSSMTDVYGARRQALDDLDDLPDSRFRSDYDELLSDRATSSLLTYRWDTAVDSETMTLRAQAMINAALERVENGLGG
jgi:tRNA U34 5-methylaminomethyl-2-thiouridine-forming methyltransferase MnmC